VYSLGVILFEALTGRLPFVAPDSDKLAEMHLLAEPPSPRSLNPAIPPELEQIILKVLAKEPSARYRTADQLGRVLARLAPAQADSPAAAFPPVPAASPEAPTSLMPGTSMQGLDWIAVGLALLAFLA
jgi:serine/threonine-protein kinase